MKTGFLLLAVLLTLVPISTSGQTATPAPQTANVEVDPIRCWWKTSAGAVHVGETFSVVLTCAVLQNQAVQVAADESRLDSTVAQMAPFEVIGGSHPADLYSPNRRFFQYEYRLRVINPDVIGKDIKIPDPQIHYRINSTVAANTAAQGRDHTYLLPPQSVRVLSLVPADAPDIRDSAKEGFVVAEQLGFRANVLQIVAITAMALGALIALFGMARLLVRRRQGKPVGKRGLAEAAILRRAGRELTAVQREVALRGWDDGLVDRSLAAARISASSALGHPVSQKQGADVEAGAGRMMAGGWLWRKPTGVSGAATTEDVSRALDKLPVTASATRRQLLEDLRSALMAFTAVQYAREATYDRTALDEALSRATAATARLRSDRTWPKPYLRRWAPGSRRTAEMSGAKA